MILALVMALALVACGNKNTDDDEQNDTPTVITNPDEVQDEMTSSDGKYEVAFVTDVGQLKDKSFNPGYLRRREAVRRQQQPVLQVLSARQRQ